MTVESLEFVRRPGTQADAEFLFDCMKGALGPYVIATYGVWDERWQRDHFTRTTDPEAHEILEIAGSPVGCVLVQEDEAYVDLHRVLLLPPFQSRGIGTRVVRQVLSSARSRGKQTRLQVFRVNPARRLYERLGFAVVSQTKTHYIMLAPPDEASSPLLVQRYGPAGRPVVVLHGGPGAPGCARRLARALADPLHVLEPWQRWSSEAPLTVDQHIQDLAAVISEYIPGERPALVGDSWGAMLGLAFASRYPDRVSALALIGCGTFDLQARAQLQRTIEQRTSLELKARSRAHWRGRAPRTATWCRDACSRTSFSPVAPGASGAAAASDPRLGSATSRRPPVRTPDRAGSGTARLRRAPCRRTADRSRA